LFKNKVQNKDDQLECSLNTVMGAVRGSNGYWNQVNGDLETMDENLKAATWFISLSSAEYDWVDNEAFLKLLNEDHLEYSLNELIRLDPVGVSMHFENRFQSFLKCVILNSNGPLGKV
jgi:hypothetical protein